MGFFMTTLTKNTSQTFKINRNNLILSGIILLISIVSTWFFASVDHKFAAIWLLSNVAGFVLQRSRFCFASGFRDLFLFGSGANMKGIILGLVVSSIGFTAILHWITPNILTGDVATDAHVFPVGISTIVGGFLFGFGMVISGGCVSGTLYRLGEGYLTSVSSLIGIFLGMGALILTWNWWYEIVIKNEPQIWLPKLGKIGYFGALSITLLVLGLIFLLINWWEAKNSIPNMPAVQNNQIAMTLKEKMTSYYKSIFIDGWSVALGGSILGGLAVIMFIVKKPFGVTGGIFELTNTALVESGIGPQVLKGLDDLGGCIGSGGETLFTAGIAMTFGTIVGSVIGSTASGEFKLRIPPTPVRYIQGLGGGIFMGYGSGLAIGCTIGALFSSIPSLSLSGWVFGLALTIGAFIGTKIIKKMI